MFVKFEGEDIKLVSEIEHRYKVKFHPKPFYHSLLTFYKKTGFLTVKQITTCNKEIYYPLKNTYYVSNE